MKSKFNLAFVIKIHKLIGVCLALWLLVMVATGILLNHSRDLNLDKTPIQSSLLLNIYGIHPPHSGQTFEVEKNISIHLIGNHLFWNNKKIENISAIEDFFLATSNTKEVLVYWPSHLALFNVNGELIEIKEGLPIKNAEAIGHDTENNFYLKTKSELFIVNSDLEFKVASNTEKIIIWANSKPTDAQTINTLNNTNFQNDIHYERLIIDVHNGNIFGYLNKFLLDFLSIFFLILILSGIYIWFRKLKTKNN